MGLKSCLKSLLKRFFGESPAPPADDCHYTSLTRYIYQSGHFSTTRAKPGAFLPPKGNLKTSAGWIDEIDDPEIWEIGDILGHLRSTPADAQARADFDSSILARENLTIEPDPNHHPRHVNLAGWPAEKDAQKDIALALVAGSKLQIR
ncbi:MAG: hypothetical protein WA581_18265 [Candidatus Acidiferrales bacterium]